MDEITFIEDMLPDGPLFDMIMVEGDAFKMGE